MIQAESNLPRAMRIREAVPYRLKPKPSADGRLLVFAERMTHRRASYAVLGLFVVLNSAGLLALLAGMPLTPLHVVSLVIFPVMVILLIWVIRLMRPNALSVDPRGGECAKTDNKGRALATFQAADAALHIVHVTVRGERDPWGYAVVVVAPEIQFPLAAVRDMERAKQYIDELPAVLRERLSPDITPVVVPGLTYRGWEWGG